MPLSAIKSPSRKDWEIVRGDSFARTLTLKSDGSLIDLTGYTAKSEVRVRAGDPNLLVAFSASVLAPSTDGQIQIRLTSSQTRSLPCECAWDLEVQLLSDPENNTFTLITGLIKVIDDVTQ